MYLLILTIASGFIFSVIFIIIFKNSRLVTISCCNREVPYSGGTVLLFSILFSLIAYYFNNKISSFKFMYLSLSLFCIYFFGFIDDLYNITEKKIFMKNTKKHFNSEFLIYLIEIISSIIVIFYIFYIFNDDFWLYKVIITLLFIDLFNCLGCHPGRSLGIYYFFMIILNLPLLQWTNELFTVSLITAAAYYFFDFLSFSVLGRSGLNILGFTLGLIYSEALGVNLFLYILSIALLLTACVILKAKVLLKPFFSNSLLNHDNSDF
jgi:UDP-N-acetylmuramyl pentapeptide phosphotransferase/UDP-N-acetylglucosamine-1-phosphate transferase